MSLTRFDLSNDIVTIKDQEFVTSTWSNNTNNLQSVHTASSQADFTTPTSSGQFYINVYNLDTGSESPTAEVQYAVAYGHKAGSGSPDFTNDTGSFGLSATRTVYSQYRQLVYQDETQNFKFGTHTSDDIYVINVNRARYKHKLNPGSLNLHLVSHSVTIKLRDNSVDNPNGYDTSPGYKLGTYYYIVSGANGTSYNSLDATQAGGTGSYGLFYPHAGLIILSPGALSNTNTKMNSVKPATNPGLSSNTDRNHVKLLNAIVSGSANDDGHFIVDTAEEINSQYYFVRAKNSQYNYTNNPSFVDANHTVLVNSWIKNPKVYITTVGLYNDMNELLAVAKLSQPVAKDFTKEALVRVKLDY